MDKFTVKLTGLKELQDALLTKTPQEVRRIIRPALVDAGEWMADEISAVAPVYAGPQSTGKGKVGGEAGGGFLKANIVSKVTVPLDFSEATVQVGPSRKAWYATFVEFGSIHNKPARPFIRPTFDEKQGAWLEHFLTQLRLLLSWSR